MGFFQYEVFYDTENGLLSDMHEKELSESESNAKSMFVCENDFTAHTFVEETELGVFGSSYFRTQDRIICFVMFKEKLPESQREDVENRLKQAIYNECKKSLQYISEICENIEMELC